MKKILLLMLTASLMLTACSGSGKQEEKSTVQEVEISDAEKDNSKEEIEDDKLEDKSEENKGDKKAEEAKNEISEEEIEKEAEDTEKSEDSTESDEDSQQKEEVKTLNVKREGPKYISHFENYNGFKEFTDNNIGEFIYNEKADIVIIKLKVLNPDLLPEKVGSEIIGKVKLSENRILENKQVQNYNYEGKEYNSDISISDERMLEIAEEVAQILKSN
ncbi:MAG: hypothetical protein Q4P34_03830 [Tissierellia bacterium]|nr:hypothetical protein [Tissierellia bacterium]